MGNGDKKTTHPVGQKVANYAGIYDMSGNVYEWCYDGWDRNVPTGEQTNPIGSVSVDNRVIRGGSWFSHVVGCTVAFRHNIEAGKVGSSMINFYTASNLGLRVACSQ